MKLFEKSLPLSRPSRRFGLLALALLALFVLAYQPQSRVELDLTAPSNEKFLDHFYPAENGERWTTVGVSPNIIDASFRALMDSIVYKLVKSDVPARFSRP